MKDVLYLVFGLAVVGGYAAMNITGIDPFAAGTERTIEAPVRTGVAGGAVGGVAGFRSYGYRGSGFRPGK